MSIHLIDTICDEFEAAVRQGETVMIEDYLQKIEESERRHLLQELLEIEIALAAENGTNPVTKRDELKNRFPEEKELIDSVVHRVTRQRQIGDYEISEELGHGGMGIVYKARQKLLNQTVAVKVLSQTLLNDPQATGRFRREMQLIGSLNHPNIVRALNAGETGDMHYLVMEFIDGITLQELGKTVLEASAACEAIRQAALGLQHAHQFGLLHRDIKPANLMLDRTGTVKILDLGLGKFISGKRPGESSSEESVSLTQAGATIGTVDYMSPEQCDNAETADIRSDIYSLGCSLYYLLTGLPPYSGSRYDTLRKKLMGHIVGNIPDIRTANPKLPDELQEIIETMLAKEPLDRFQTPLEVAQALAPFSDFDALFALCNAPANQVPRPLAGSTSRMTGRTLKSFRYRKHFFVQNPSFLAAVLVSFCFLAAVGGYLFYQNPSDKTPDSNVSSSTASDEQTLRSTLRTDLALLPGLNGAWWFAEMPFYLPFVREKILNKLDAAADVKTLLGENPEKYYDPNVSAVYVWLEKIIGNFRNDFSPTELQILDTITKIGQENVQPENIYQETLECVKQEKEPRPVHLHTQAVLEHCLAVLRNDKALAAEASRHYADALAAYQKETSVQETKNNTVIPPSRLLEFLCLSDAARLEYLATGNYNTALQKFADFSKYRRTGERTSPLFIAEFYSVYGSLCAEAGKYDNSLFARAKERLERSKAGERIHPLAAQLAERYAWSLLDQWKVNDAYEQFEFAVMARAANRRESGNPYATVFILHDLHGLALSQRYRGDFIGAVDNFRRTLKEADATLNEKNLPINTGYYSTRWYKNRLRERAANTRERLADCLLYGGAASHLLGQGRLTEIAQYYAEAADLYDDEGTKRIMSGKQAIVLLLQDNIAEAELILRKLDERKRNLLGNQQRNDLVRQLADALLYYKKETEKSPDERKRLLRLFLEQFTLSGNPYSADAARRETLELRLFAAEFLVGQALNDKDEKIAVQDIQILKQPLDFLMERLESRPFVRRYCDLIIRAYTFLYERSQQETAQQLCLREIARLLDGMRLKEEQEQVPETAQSAEQNNELPSMVLFFFTDTASDGFVLYYPQDGRSGALYPMPLTRQQIKSGRKPDEPAWNLDVRLLEAVQKDRAVERPIKILWNDEPAWARPEDALRDSDYPFSEELNIL